MSDEFDYTGEIEAIWNQCLREIEANDEVAKRMQLRFEETIGNIAALRTINEPVVDTIKNLLKAEG